jgi:RNA polymerase sigma-54 factor
MGDMNRATRQGLSTGLGQRLSLATDITESLRLLSLPGVELAREVDAALEENIMLEREEPPADLDAPPGADAIDAYMTSAAQAIEETQSAEEDLRTHLIQQLPLENFSPRDRLIAETLVDALEEDGYLRTSEAALLDALPELEPAASVEELEMVIRRIQLLDPTGVAARDHAECLLMQLSELADSIPARRDAEILLREHFHELGRGPIKTLARRAGLKPDDARDALSLIQTLDPHPGYRYSTTRIEYLVPELLARRSEAGWEVAFNPAVNPGLRVNAAYARCIARRHDADSKALTEQAQTARLLVSQLAGRRETLLKVGASLVRHQRAFLDSGPTRLAPLTMQAVAGELELHESTVSRTVQGKSIATPRGTIPLRHFFSASVSKTQGSGISSRAVKARIKALIAGENSAAPLSDAALVAALADDDIRIARRTVAKHREALGLASTRERRRPARA